MVLLGSPGQSEEILEALAAVSLTYAKQTVELVQKATAAACRLAPDAFSHGVAKVPWSVQDDLGGPGHVGVLAYTCRAF